MGRPCWITWVGRKCDHKGPYNKKPGMSEPETVVGDVTVEARGRETGEGSQAKK